MIRRFLALTCALTTSAFAQQEEQALPPATPRPRAAQDLANETLVVFNENDIDSTALAGLYVEKRGIPAKNLISLRCSRSEEIPRKEYDDTIAEPLRRELRDRGLWKVSKEPTQSGRVTETKIRFMVLMYGVPLRVGETGAYEGNNPQGQPPEVFKFNASAVDSELALLGLWTKQISGALENPYFRNEQVIEDAGMPSQLLVTRLDGPGPAVVRRMIEDSVAAEAKGLRGFTYIDAQGLKPGPLQMGDRWFHRAARDAREHGQPVILDNGPALFPDLYPMRHAAIYLGWYAEHAAGPFLRETFRFEPGAVAMHLHSFSSVTLRDSKANWCGPLLAAGAAATLGNVAEPFLGLTPQPDIFAQRLREGFTFAEAAYMSQRALSWMTTMVGDPIYRPFLNLKNDPSNEWDAYRAGVQTWLTKDRASGEAALKESAKRLKSGIVSESLGLLELSGNDHKAALDAFRQARLAYTNADDRARVAMHEVTAIVATKGNAEAGKFLRDQVAANSDAASAPLLAVLSQMYGSADAKPKSEKAEEKKPDQPKTETKPAEPKKTEPAPKKKR